MLSDFTIDWGVSHETYKNVYYILVAIPILCLFVKNVSMQGNTYLLQKQPIFFIALLVSFLILFLGFRSNNHSDMGGYIMVYNAFVSGQEVFSWDTEWFWGLLINACKNAHLSVWIWFAIIEFVYIGGMFVACRRLLHENVLVAMLFMLSAFQCFAYGTNTIRNGFACSLVLIAISLLKDNKCNYVVVVAIFLLALGSHRSTVIPIISIGLSVFVIKQPKHAIYLWLACIVLSAVVGNRFSSLFSGISFDERFQSYYVNANQNVQSLFRRSGFRWDFLLYSSVPVVVTWIATEVKEIKDRMFNIISTVYILSNSVWVLCIRANFSDRFAYLSWFLYPLVLAYAFIRLPMYKNQDSAVAWVLLCYFGFTFIMNFVIGAKS